MNISARQVAFSRTELLVIVSILGLLTALLLPAVQSGRNPKGPPGEMIPTAPPVESNRVTHATGLSIIAPVNWDQIRDMGPDYPFLCIAARGAPGRRLKSLITISPREPVPDKNTLQSCRLIRFQEAPAYESVQVEREDTFDDPASSRYVLYVERNGVWWCITFDVAAKMTELPNSVRQYIETIEFPTSRRE